MAEEAKKPKEDKPKKPAVAKSDKPSAKKPTTPKSTKAAPKKPATKKALVKKDTAKKTPSKKSSSKKAETKTEKAKEPVKTKPKAEKKETNKTKGEKTEVNEKPEIEDGYKPKKKPELSKELKSKLKTRKQIKKRTPEFLREEWFRYKRVPKNWRRPDGITSKMRINLKYRPSKVRVGFRGPRETRGLHSSGFEEVFVYNAKDLEAINPKTQAARIGGSVGTKKRVEIEKKAEKLEVRILNL